MPDMTPINEALLEARLAAGLSQQQLAQLVATSQAAIANLEQGLTNPTMKTLCRVATVLGFSIRIELTPSAAVDRVVERYKDDVDRTLLRENLRKSIDERIRTLGEWQDNGRLLQHATRAAMTNQRKHDAT